MDTVHENTSTKEVPTESKPKPRREYKHRTLDLPAGMTERVLAWACGVKPGVLYKWKKGVPMSDLARLAIALWNHLGEDEFVRMMREVRQTDPPTELDEKEKLPDLILKILEGAEGPVTSQFVEEILEIEFGKYTTKDSLRTMLWNLKRQGRIFSAARNRWTLSAPEETQMPSGPDPTFDKNETRSGPSENKEEKI